MERGSDSDLGLLLFRVLPPQMLCSRSTAIGLGAHLRCPSLSHDHSHTAHASGPFPVKA